MEGSSWDGRDGEGGMTHNTLPWVHVSYMTLAECPRVCGQNDTQS